ncbi:radical SAM protein [Streptomyces sp. NPDC048416]|uniref:radical SAM protein n=1 Tax=Streptomyces sp. NPDC048416 TaxID=3365546 RepID=UPI00371343D5
MPTSYCNMGCEYCGQEHTKGAVRGRHRDAVADRVDRAMRSPGTRRILVNWFGAEPMMAYAIIRSLSTTFLTSARRHGSDYHARMITNGSLLRH